MNATGTTDTDIRQHILDVAKPLILCKGFTAVGLTELLAAAQVPKGSFYHYFASKEAFGEALLSSYFSSHLAQLDDMFARPAPAAQRLMSYFEYWLAAQAGDDPAAKCLAVKLSAEVSDLSESMRKVLDAGTRGITQRLEACIAAGKADGSLPVAKEAGALAMTLYQTWLGASLMEKISRSRAPLESAMAGTRELLNAA